MRTIAIGDIHGCLRALEGLVAAIEPTESDRLIFLGDYVDRGPHSKGVIDLLLELRKRCQMVCLLGNHEVMLRLVLNGPITQEWLQLGGSETLASYGGSLKNMPGAHVDFLFSLRPYYETESAVFVHANYDAELAMQDQPEELLYWEHLGVLPGPHRSGKKVFVGHTPQISGEVGDFGYLKCLDTFCFGGGWLTAMEVDQGCLWQVSKTGKLRQKRRFLDLLRKKIGEVRSVRVKKPHLELGSDAKASNST